jgi:hypothetical protein
MVRRLVPTRMPERASADRAVLDALLDEVLVAHVGVSLAEGPLASRPGSPGTATGCCSTARPARGGCGPWPTARRYA